MSYANALTCSYLIPAATLSTAATLASIIGPRGKVGVLKGIGAVVTTNTTVAATELRVGDVGDADQYGILSVPVATAGPAAAYNEATLYPSNTNLMPADTAVVIATDGGCTAGAADVMVTIDWF
jgi:hypothetical protein